jgi:hypothetical protein
MRKTLLLLLVAILLGTTVLAQAKRSAGNRRSKRPRVQTFEEFTAARRKGWRLATEGASTKLYYDPSKIARPGRGIVRLWVKFINEPPAGGVATTLTLQEYDCASERHRSIAFTDYSPSGKAVASTEDSERPWRYVTPETVTSNMFNILCRGAKDLEQINEEYVPVAYSLAESFERDGDYESALFFYEEVDRLTPRVAKVKESIRRVKGRLPRRMAKPLPDLPTSDASQPVTPP